MAAVSLLGNTFTTVSGVKTVTAIPAAGDLIVLVTAHTGNVSAATPTDSQGGVYTTVASAKKNADADTLMMHVRTALIPAAVSTVFTHDPGVSTGGGLHVVKIGGMSKRGAAALKQLAAIQANQAASTPAPVLGAAPQASNPVIAALFNGTNPATMTPRAGYLEHADIGYATPTAGLEVMVRDAGEASATIPWGSASASAFCAVALELDTDLPLSNDTVAMRIDGFTQNADGSIHLRYTAGGAPLPGAWQGQGILFGSKADVSEFLTASNASWLDVTLALHFIVALWRQANPALDNPNIVVGKTLVFDPANFTQTMYVV
jgi:hypothetical protein